MAKGQGVIPAPLLLRPQTDAQLPGGSPLVVCQEGSVPWSGEVAMISPEFAGTNKKTMPSWGRRLT